MKPDAPSLTARGVALARASYDRPSSPTGDPAANFVSRSRLPRASTSKRCSSDGHAAGRGTTDSSASLCSAHASSTRRWCGRSKPVYARSSSSAWATTARGALPHTRRALLRGGPSRDASRQASPPRAGRRVARRHHVRHGRLHGRRARTRGRRGRDDPRGRRSSSAKVCCATCPRCGSTSCCASPRNSPRRSASSR